MGTKKTRLSEVQRILAVREHVRKCGVVDVASSVSAFIAWKALLVAAQSMTGATEVERVAGAVDTTLRAAPDRCRGSVEAFTSSLQRLGARDISPQLQAEWLLDQYGDPAVTTSQILRTIKRLHRAVEESTDAVLWRVANDLARAMRIIRHVVLGHAQVTTSTPLFSSIVAPFEELSAVVALVLHDEVNK